MISDRQSLENCSTCIDFLLYENDVVIIQESENDLQGFMFQVGRV